MSKRVLKIAAITASSLIAVLYILFLSAPLFLNGVLNSYSADISKMVEEASGFKLKLENLQILTTPKLTAGLKAGHIEVSLSTDEKFLSADNVQGKISLLPLLMRKIEIDMAGADNLNVNLKVQKDGKFLIENYIPQADNSNDTQPQNSAAEPLPFGIKLSNHLPDIILNNYNLSFIDMQTDKSYYFSGNKIKISDFILNKKVKVLADGKVLLQDRNQFNYDVKIFNKIMPDMDLNELVFSPKTENAPAGQPISLNVIDIFKAIHNNYVTADLKADVKTFGTPDNINWSGTVNVSNLGAAVDNKKLPSSNIDITLKGNKINLYSKLYTAEKELTEVVADIKTGKHPKIDLNCKSDAKFKSIFDMADSIAKSFGYHDLDTLTATGGIDADFSLKSDMKKVESSGYLKIPSSSITYKLYNAYIKDIKADIDFSGDTVNIKDAGFKVAEQPLKVNGTISNDINAHVIADKLQLKALLVAAGQLGLLKDNDIKSGTLSLDASLTGKLDKPVPKVSLNVDNVNIKNIPSNTSVILMSSNADVNTDGKSFTGGIDINNLKVLNPVANISAPKSKISFGQKDINIDNAYVLLNNSRIDITGMVSDYTTKDINFDINAKGNILSSDVKSMIPADLRKEVASAGSLPLSVKITGNDKAQNIAVNLSANTSNYVSILSVDALKGKNTVIKSDIKIANDSLKLSDTGVYANGVGVLEVKGSVNNLSKSQTLALDISTPQQISMEIPTLKKSNLKAKGNISVSGAAVNPVLKGNIDIPVITIPDMLLKMENMSVNLNGVIANGKGTLAKFTSGGITAQNLTSDFSFKDNVFYLKNLTGEAFDGKINGNISYNIINGKIGVIFKGSGMNAEKAIAGAAGLKNALSGTLGFDANVTLHGATDVEMMKNLKGKVSFEITDGTFGNIGRFENYLFAQNLQSNSIIKAAINSVAALPTVKNTAEFKSVSGNMAFNNGWASLSPIKTSGPSMSSYITGKYNLLNATANVIVLGRISAEVVSLLGPLGDLSVSKLTSYIPKFGTLTGNLINALTTDPKSENVSAIPLLSSGNKNYKDFKVVFNGGVESRSSVKSFKWLSKCDTSEIEQVTVKEQIENTKQAIQEAKQHKVEQLQKSLEESRAKAQEAKQQMQDAKEGLKNLKNLLK